jgi:hypothetical protein
VCKKGTRVGEKSVTLALLLRIKKIFTGTVYNIYFTPVTIPLDMIYS